MSPMILLLFTQMILTPSKSESTGPIHEAKVSCPTSRCEILEAIAFSKDGRIASFYHNRKWEPINLGPTSGAMSKWQPYALESTGIDTREKCESAKHHPGMVHGTVNQWRRDGRCGYIFPIGANFHDYVLDATAGGGR